MPTKSRVSAPNVTAFKRSQTFDFRSIFVSSRGCFNRGSSLMCHSEPTSVIKSASILPAISSALGSNFDGSPIKFASPNLLELAALYKCARMEPWELMSRDYWWRTIDDFSIGTEFRLSLDRLARENAGTKGKTLSFL